MAEYNFNNILAELRKGADIDDVMKSFTTQVNAALEQRKNDKQYLDKQYEALAAEWSAELSKWAWMFGERDYEFFDQ